MGIPDELRDFRKKITDNFPRDKIKDTIYNLDVDIAGIKSDMNKIVQDTDRDKSVNWQREYALKKGRIFVCEQKKEMLLMQEYALRKLDEIDKM